MTLQIRLVLYLPHHRVLIPSRRNCHFTPNRNITLLWKRITKLLCWMSNQFLPRRYKPQRFHKRNSMSVRYLWYLIVRYRYIYDLEIICVLVWHVTLGVLRVVVGFVVEEGVLRAVSLEVGVGLALDVFSILELSVRNRLILSILITPFSSSSSSSPPNTTIRTTSILSLNMTIIILIIFLKLMMLFFSLVEERWVTSKLF